MAGQSKYRKELIQQIKDVMEPFEQATKHKFLPADLEVMDTDDLNRMLNTSMMLAYFIRKGIKKDLQKGA